MRFRNKYKISKYRKYFREIVNNPQDTLPKPFKMKIDIYNTPSSVLFESPYEFCSLYGNLTQNTKYSRIETKNI